MSRHVPGTKDWWVETGLIAATGFALAAWLWDGPLAERAALMEEAEATSIEAAEAAPPPRTMADFLEAGCFTSDTLRALREGDRVVIDCPAPRPPYLRDLPPEQRPFP
ncbi:hypothetical protein [Gymnodinialimonas ulvae]|uniref:hypothetical protein n=1 Tax=Gymnodinialimonas ulvae TaxID=3126504 RepID=UPI003096E147